MDKTVRDDAECAAPRRFAGMKPVRGLTAEYRKPRSRGCEICVYLDLDLEIIVK